MSASKPHLLITGGSGFLGSALCQNYLRQGYHLTLLTRNPTKTAAMLSNNISVFANLAQIPTTSTFDAVINLAGAPIFGQRWTTSRKQILHDSRIGLTTRLINFLRMLEYKPKVLLSASAIGIYGNQGDSVLNEQSPGTPCFSQELCQAWERCALQAEDLGIRVCLLRTGLVLDANGGMLSKLLPIYRLGLGGKLGDGQQWQSWIDKRDWLAAADFLLQDQNIAGAINFTAPAAVPNADFNKALALHLHRPAFFNLPESVLKLLLGEMSELLLSSQRVYPERLLTAGFRFKYPDLESALSSILSH